MPSESRTHKVRLRAHPIETLGELAVQLVAQARCRSYWSKPVWLMPLVRLASTLPNELTCCSTSAPDKVWSKRSPAKRALFQPTNNSAQAARPASWRAAYEPDSSDRHSNPIQSYPSAFTSGTLLAKMKTQVQNEVTALEQLATAANSAPRATPNPSIERTRSGSAGLAFISFWAKPAPPPRAAHVKR